MNIKTQNKNNITYILCYVYVKNYGTETISRKVN
jgi:hypothetical protein